MEAGIAAPSLTPEAIASLSDAELLRAAVERVRRPAAEIRSFALHAPLELLSRAALLAHVPPAQRELARLQLATTALHYEKTTPFLPLPDVESATVSGDVDAQLEALRFCIAEGDMAGSARATAVLARALPMHRLAVALVPGTLDTLAAAGHAPIFFQRAAALDPVRAAAARPLLVALVPELARSPELRFGWSPTPQGGGALDPSLAALERSLAGHRRPEAAALGSIFGMIHATEQAGAPQRVLAPALALDWGAPPVADRLTRLACRIAARSMIAEPTDFAKYGWSHALTLAHANRALLPLGGDAGRCTRNALLFALASRHTMARAPLPERVELANPGLPLSEALRAGPDEAAAAAWHQPASGARAAWSHLAGEAAIRNDAHLVKHTLSALELAAEDPEREPLYRAAAARLVAVWVAEQPAERIHATLDRRD